MNPTTSGTAKDALIRHPRLSGKKRIQSRSPERHAATDAHDFKLLQANPDRKFLIFTQFADPAYYLNNALRTTGLDPVDCATGRPENSAFQARKFFPESNARLKHHPPGKQTRILIATNVLS